MFDNIISAETQAELQNLLDKTQKVVITCHISPDGDAIGSVTAMASLMRRLGKKATIIVPDLYPDFLAWIPGSSEILIYNKAAHKDAAEKAIDEADLIAMMDHNALSRMNELGEYIEKKSIKRLIVDHHPEPDPTADVIISHPELCATCELLYRIMWQMGWAKDLTYDEATSIYTGMMTDTGAFTFASNRPEVFEIIAQLLRTGIDKDKIYRNVFWTQSAERLRLTGFMLYVKMEIVNGMNATILTLNNKERKLFQTKNGDTEGIVNMPLQINGMRLSIFLRQDTENKQKIRVSLRSVDDFPCNEMSARFFNGGGHKNASGGSLMCSMDEAIEKAHEAIKAYAHLLR